MTCCDCRLPLATVPSCNSSTNGLVAPPRHDADFDIGLSQGEPGLAGPRHQSGNAAAVTKYGPKKTLSWMTGGGPYDDWWHFVDAPRIKRSSGRTTGGPPISYGRVTGPIYDPTAPKGPSLLPPAGSDPRGAGTVPLLEWRF